MKKAPINLHDIVLEISCLTDITQDLIDRAKASDVTVENNRLFKGLVENWYQGIYDEDMEAMKSEIEYILNVNL